METTFILKPDELNRNFLTTLRKLFKNSPQLQISVSVPEDFNLLHSETPAQTLQRVEKCLEEVKSSSNTIVFTESELDDIILEKL